jgi:hypothetical protein
LPPVDRLNRRDVYPKRVSCVVRVRSWLEAGGWRTLAEKKELRKEV